jgi:type II secretory pathway predicted ATPase ExeA
VVARNLTQDLGKSSQVLLIAEPSLQPYHSTVDMRKLSHKVTILHTYHKSLAANYITLARIPQIPR